ncbi:MAG: ammonium transporter [Candidatus Hinthialibacter antarcticus]|nr:ammonium transporter [Candidatus Hinthialibacter antarcticus]
MRIQSERANRWFSILAVLVIATVMFSGVASAQDAEAAFDAETELSLLRDDANILWTCLAAFLVFFMQAGFAMVEAGFTRAKNAVNIMMKNLMDFSIGSIIFFLFGFGLMFGTTYKGFIGTDGFALFGYMFAEDGSPEYWTYTFWIFQTVFAATAATIVSGAMAERTKFKGYLVYTVFITGLVYPVFGSWAWGSLFAGEGWLEGLGFIDFAGSTVVHSVGGWAALAGAIVLGPRIGKYGADGKPRVIPGHNVPMAALGVFILWLGWFGFNPGSTTAVGGDMAVIAVTTNLAAAAGAIGAMVTAWIKFGKPDAGMSLNGALAGLVSITAPCYNVSPVSAIIIGFLGGIIVVISVLAIENMGIDDPVGAVSVHGVCGAWGTIAAGLFAQEAFGGVNGLFFGGGASQLVTQFIGVGAGFLWTFIVSFAIFSLVKATIGLRVSEEEEMEGLDFGEHGASAYSDFSVVTSR